MTDAELEKVRQALRLIRNELVKIVLTGKKPTEPGSYLLKLPYSDTRRVDLLLGANDELVAWGYVGSIAKVPDGGLWSERIEFDEKLTEISHE